MWQGNEGIGALRERLGELRPEQATGGLEPLVGELEVAVPVNPRQVRDCAGERPVIECTGRQCMRPLPDADIKRRCGGCVVRRRQKMLTAESVNHMAQATPWVRRRVARHIAVLAARWWQWTGTGATDPGQPGEGRTVAQRAGGREVRDRAPARGKPAGTWASSIASDSGAGGGRRTTGTAGVTGASSVWGRRAPVGGLYMAGGTMR